MIKRARRQNNYSIIDNEVFKSNQLTWEAQGLLANILSKPDGWSILPAALVKVTEGTRKQSKINAIYTILRELKEAGFVEMKRLSTGKVQYTVFDSTNHANNPNEDNPNEDNPNEDNPNEDNHHALVSTDTPVSTEKKLNTDLEENQDQNLSSKIKNNELGKVTREQLEHYCKYRHEAGVKNDQSLLLPIVQELNSLPVRISIDDAIDLAIKRGWKGLRQSWVLKEFITSSPDYDEDIQNLTASKNLPDDTAKLEFNKMLNHHKQKGSEVLNWIAAWEFWLSNYKPSDRKGVASTQEVSNQSFKPAEPARTSADDSLCQNKIMYLNLKKRSESDAQEFLSMLEGMGVQLDLASETV